jgi:hypothetical protein
MYKKVNYELCLISCFINCDNVVEYIKLITWFEVVKQVYIRGKHTHTHTHTHARTHARTHIRERTYSDLRDPMTEPNPFTKHTRSPTQRMVMRCYTVVTLLLHCCYTVVRLLLYFFHTIDTLLCRDRRRYREPEAVFIPLLHHCNTALEQKP